MPEGPNVLLIMTDQFRADWYGAAGASWVRTPNLDRLAERGVVFRNCFTNSPVCAPARIGLASGLQPVRLGATDNHAFLPVSTPTYYQRLRDREYRVGCMGKLDLAKPDGYNGRYGDRPCTFGWGFTHPCECEGKMHAGKSPAPRGPYGLHLEAKGLFRRFYEDYTERGRNGWHIHASHDSVLDTADWEDCYVGRRSVEWLEWVPDDFPWHFFVSFVGPHDPFDPPSEYADRYRDADMPPAVPPVREGRPRTVAGRMRDYDAEQIAHTRRQYSAEIELLDEWIGRMVDVLERRGMLDNTHILFTSDHGEMLGDHGLYAKSVMYEGALHVPLLAAGPGIEGGRVSDAVVELIDVGATVCDLAGVGEMENVDARSFASVLRGRAEAHRSEAVSQLTHCRCVRTERHKLIETYNDAPELYDLSADPCEQQNLAAVQPDLARDLRGRLMSRLVEGKWRR